MATRIVHSMLVVALLSALSTPVLAQEDGQSVPACEISGGYAFLRDFDLEENLPGGGYFAAAANLTRWFGIIGEVNFNRRTFDMDDVVSVTGTVVSGGVGPRVFRKVDRFVPYAQMLAGATYARAELRSVVMDADADDTFFSLQPGGGVLMYFNSRVGAQVAVDYRWVDPTAGDGEDWSEFRFATGIVVGFGSR
jgi:hypothetical protein